MRCSGNVRGSITRTVLNDDTSRLTRAGVQGNHVGGVGQAQAQPLPEQVACQGYPEVEVQ